MNYIRLCSKDGETSTVIDFHKKQAMMRVNTSWIEGVKLEILPEGENGFYPGIMLIRREWKNMYFVKERKGWDEEIYFELAERLFDKNGIKNP